MVGGCISYWISPLLGDMLVFRGVSMFSGRLWKKETWAVVNLIPERKTLFDKMVACDTPVEEGDSLDKPAFNMQSRVAWLKSLMLYSDLK